MRHGEVSKVRGLTKKARVVEHREAAGVLGGSINPFPRTCGLVGIQSWDRVKGTKARRVMERVRVSLGAIFSITVSRCGAWAGPSGMTR